MVDAGLLADVSAAIGAHNNPNYAPGQIAVGPEPMMAGCVKFHVTLHATGTHAGYPHKAPARSRRSPRWSSHCRPS